MASPYAELPPSRYWKTGVERCTSLSSAGLYRKKFDIPRGAKIATAGSCFAQHIGRVLRERGYNVLDLEPAPDGLPPERLGEFGYGLYSARHGNIYVVRQLLQLAREAFGEWTPSDVVWQRDGRFFDALRPSVEPCGLSCPEEVMAHRAYHVERVRKVLETADIYVFTLGLTESWVHAASGTVYPTAPGVLAGDYDPQVYRFVNFRTSEVADDLRAFRDLVRRRNPSVRILLTVSPVPLTATASAQHVLSATIRSKSVLRAAAAELYEDYDDVEYFPSYELIAAHPTCGQFYRENKRQVDPKGVATVMEMFLAEHRDAESAGQEASDDAFDEAVCEEALLEGFAL